MYLYGLVYLVLNPRALSSGISFQFLFQFVLLFGLDLPSRSNMDDGPVLLQHDGTRFIALGTAGTVFEESNRDINLLLANIRKG